MPPSALGTADPSSALRRSDPYVTWRNPFVYFDVAHAGSACASDDVGLDAADEATCKADEHHAGARLHRPEPLRRRQRPAVRAGAPAGLAPAQTLPQDGHAGDRALAGVQGRRPDRDHLRPGAADRRRDAGSERAAATTRPTRTSPVRGARHAPTTAPTATTGDPRPRRPPRHHDHDHRRREPRRRPPRRTTHHLDARSPSGGQTHADRRRRPGRAAADLAATSSRARSTCSTTSTTSRCSASIEKLFGAQAARLRRRHRAAGVRRRRCSTPRLTGLARGGDRHDAGERSRDPELLDPADPLAEHDRASSTVTSG